MIYINRDPLNKYENTHSVEKLSRCKLLFNHLLDTTFPFTRESYMLSSYDDYKEFRSLSWYDFFHRGNSLSHNEYYAGTVIKTLSYYKDRKNVREDKTVDIRDQTDIIKYIKSKT